MWTVLTKTTEDGEVSLGVVLVEGGELKMDVPGRDSRDEIEPLFRRGDITYTWVGYGDEMRPAKCERLSDRWFVAVLNSLPEPYGWREIHRETGRS
jgi:hypothetical protein